MSHSQSMTSTPSSLACEPAARSSLARWSATKTAIGSAMSAARRGSSSSWRSRSAEGSGRPPTASPVSVVVPGYHLSKRHWNTVTLDGSVPDEDAGTRRSFVRPGAGGPDQDSTEQADHLAGAPAVPCAGRERTFTGTSGTWPAVARDSLHAPV